LQQQELLGLTIAGVAAALSGTAATVITIGVTAITFPLTTSIVEGMLPEKFILPLYEITPQEIFSNKIPLLDVDFFNPSESQTFTKKKLVKEASEETTTIKENEAITEARKYGYTDSVKGKEIESTSSVNSGHNTQKNVITQYKWKNNGDEYILNIDSFNKAQIFKNLPKKIPNNKKSEDYVVWSSDNAQEKEITQTTTSPAEYETETTEMKSTAAELRGVVANWYIVLRNIALVALLSVLVYIGIRIIISSTAVDKAKYKQMLIDWLVAICLLFLMQYIMSFSNLIVKKIINVVDTTKVSTDNTTESNIVEPQVYVIGDKKKVTKSFEVLVGDDVSKGSNVGDNTFAKYFLNDDYTSVVDSDGNIQNTSPTKMLWPAENFMQQARMEVQLLSSESKTTYTGVGWKLIYVMLVIYTFIFMFTYIKRVIYMAFLTIISPLVALTYPIDKMNDGQAQAFNKWFREYIFNLLIQPMHLILYTILIGSAMEFASKNIIYVIVALGFMTPAEKLLRSFFGFEKATTPGLFGGPAGAAIMMNGWNKLLGRTPPPPPKDGKGVKEVAGKAGASRAKLNYAKDLDNSSLFSVGDNKDRMAVGDNGGESPSGGPTNDDGGVLPGNVGGNNPAGIGAPGENTSISNPSGQNSNNIRTNDVSGITDGVDLSRVPRVFTDTSENIRMPENNNSEKKQIKGLARVGKGVSNVAKHYVRKAANSDMPRKVLRTAGRAVGGTVAATGASILSLSTGDPKTVGKAAIGSAMLGAKLADSVMDRGEYTGREIADNFSQGYYTNEQYDQKQLDKEYGQKRFDIDYNDELERVLGDRKTAKAAMKSVGKDCINYGLNDAKDVASVYQRMQAGESKEDAMMQVQYVKDFGKNTASLGSKDDDDLNKTIEKKIRRNSKEGTKEEEIQKHVKELRDKFDATSSVFYKKY